MLHMISQLQKLRYFNKLKSTYRFNSVDDRKESTAEHSWGCLVLADYFLSSTSYGLDRLKVYELLMYHDLIEIETGDIPIQNEELYQNAEVESKKALSTFDEKLPTPINKKFNEIFMDYTFGQSDESIFARAISALEAEVHELDYKKDWVGWTKKQLIDRKRNCFSKFPEMMAMFDEIVEYLEENNFFDSSVKDSLEA